MSAHGSRPTSSGSWHGTCPTCGEPTVTRNGQTTHTVAGRGDRWKGTLAELLDCWTAPRPVRPELQPRECEACDCQEYRWNGHSAALKIDPPSTCRCTHPAYRHRFH